MCKSFPISMLFVIPFKWYTTHFTPLGCVLCSPGCFSLFRASALMDENVMRTYTRIPEEPREHIQYDQGEWFRVLGVFKAFVSCLRFCLLLFKVVIAIWMLLLHFKTFYYSYFTLRIWFEYSQRRWRPLVVHPPATARIQSGVLCRLWQLYPLSRWILWVFHSA